MARKTFSIPTINRLRVPIVGSGGGGGTGEILPGGPPQLATSVTDSRWGSDTTFELANARLMGKFWDGSVYAVVPIGETETFLRAIPEWDGKFHGSECNPTPWRASKRYGFCDCPLSDKDYSSRPPASAFTAFGYYRYFDGAERATFPRLVAPWDVIWSARSFTDMGDPAMNAARTGFHDAPGGGLRWTGRPPNRTIKHFFVIPEVPPLNALPPSIWKTGARLLKNGGTEYYTIEDIRARLSLLPKFPVPLGAPTPQNILPIAQKMSLPGLGSGPPSANFDGNVENFVQPSDQGSYYGRENVGFVSEVLLWLCLNWTDEEKLPVAVWAARRGIDVFDTPGRATAGEGVTGGSLMEGWMALCVFGGFLLGNSAMQNFYSTLSGNNKTWSAHEINQAFYATASDVSLIQAATAYRRRLPVVAGKAYWTNKYNPPVGGSGAVYGPPDKAAYQLDTSRFWAGEILAMLACDIEDSIAHPALFDYMDWWMGTQPERAHLDWINRAWDAIRSQCTRAIYNWAA